MAGKTAVPLQKTVVLNVVGLTPRLIGEHTPFLDGWCKERSIGSITPSLPAVTCTAQSNYLTGAFPETHGIVGNGWLFRDELEAKLWRQSNQLVQSEKIWETARKRDRSFTCASMFWWYNMYSSVDYSVTPRPNYLADGRKIPDIYTHPSGLRDLLDSQLGPFPLFHFWGPRTSILSSRWIADASILVDLKYDPTLTLVYLPHLDYNLQRYGHHHPSVSQDLIEIDSVCRDLITHYQNKGTRVIVLSEYGITNVHRPIHLNRILREQGMVAIRTERGLELLDAGASLAFALADHQIAHVYVKVAEKVSQIRTLLQKVEGVDLVLGKEEKKAYGLDHPRSGELVAIADKDSWFSYYYWFDDQKAPDFARTVDIHKKPGYDPVEMFVDPSIAFPMANVALKLLKKKLGFRTLMDIIPLDASLVKGSHGRIDNETRDQPVFISDQVNLSSISAPQVFNLILAHLEV